MLRVTELRFVNRPSIKRYMYACKRIQSTTTVCLKVLVHLVINVLV